MLKRIHPLVSADLLYLMRCMGHGDELVLVDRNFPADSIAKHTITGELVTMHGSNNSQALAAILYHYMLDSFVEHPMRHMSPTDNPTAVLPVHADALGVAKASDGDWVTMAPVERFAFYEEAKKGYCVVQTGETRGYACFLLKKGVIVEGGEHKMLPGRVRGQVLKRSA
jgi:L-fucose mutarotase